MLKEMSEKRIIILIAIIILLLLVSIFLICNLKKNLIKLSNGKASQYLSATMNIKFAGENRIEYVLEIKPKEDKTFENVRVTYLVSMPGKMIKGDREVDTVIRFKTDSIKVSKDGKYKGMFSRDLGEMNYVKAPDNIKLIVIESSGTIK